MPQTRSLLTAQAAIAIVLGGDEGDVENAFDEGRAAERILVAAGLLGLAAGIAWINPVARAGRVASSGCLLTGSPGRSSPSDTRPRPPTSEVRARGGAPAAIRDGLQRALASGLITGLRVSTVRGHAGWHHGPMQRPGEGKTISLRALNRATLDRQLLLRRSRLSVPATLEHLVGMQAQTPHTAYVGLWTRLEGFRGDDLSTLLLDRSVVRIALMRGTIHLVTARTPGASGRSSSRSWTGSRRVSSGSAWPASTSTRSWRWDAPSWTSNRGRSRRSATTC